MITIKIRNWVPIGGVTHISTTYQVATDINFSNIVDDNQQDTQNLSVYYSPVIIPVNTTYYVRVNRYFSNGTNSGWGDVIAVSNQQANAGVITYEPIKVYQPVVTIDSIALTDPTVLTYTITTNAFVGKNEGHGYTIWIVLNDNNEVIEYSKSTTNLTSISFNKGNSKFLNTTYIRVIAIHGTLTNIESRPGSVVKTITEAGFKLKITSGVHSPRVDLLVEIIRTLTAINHTVSSVVLQDLNGTTLWEQPISPTTNNVTIPGVFFDEETQYLITGYGVPSIAKFSYTIPVTVRPVAVLDRLDLGYVYSKVVTLTPGSNRFPINTVFGLRESFNSKIIIPSANTLMHTVMNADSSFSTVDTAISGVSMTALGVDMSYVRPIAKDRVLLDYGYGTSVRTTIYNLDYYHNSATIIASSLITGSSIAINNGIVFTGTEEFFIARDNSATLDKYTITGSSLAVVNVALPVGETAIKLVTNDSGSNLLVFCKDAIEIHSYSLATETYTKKYTLPVAFRGRTLKQEKLVNGDVIVWKPIRVETVNGTTITDTVLDMLYIDNSNSTCTHILPITGITFNTKGSILTNSGKVLLVTDAPIGSNVLVFE